jgi:hypothetical protein
MIETPVENVTAETAEPVEAVKPYTFRLLGAPDIFLMAKIIKKIGVKEFKAVIDIEGFLSLVMEAFSDAKKENAEDANDSTNIVGVGIGVAVDLADIILGNLHKCEEDIYQMLSQTSNLSVETIKAPGNAVMFIEMLFDFFKKEEFRDFFKAVSKLF